MKINDTKLDDTKVYESDIFPLIDVDVKEKRSAYKTPRGLDMIR